MVCNLSAININKCLMNHLVFCSQFCNYSKLPWISFRIALILNPSSTTELIAYVSAWSVLRQTLRIMVDWMIANWLRETCFFLFPEIWVCQNGHACPLASMFLWFAFEIFCFVAPWCIPYCDKYNVLPVGCIWLVHQSMVGMLLCFRYSVNGIYQVLYCHCN